MTHDEFYLLPESAREPATGDKIRVNYGTGMWIGYEVVEVRRSADADGDTLSFVCLMPGVSSRGLFYLNEFHMVGSRCVKRYSYRPNTAGWVSNGGGLDGDGLDEIRIERPALQPSLFAP